MIQNLTKYVFKFVSDLPNIYLLYSISSARKIRNAFQFIKFLAEMYLLFSIFSFKNQIYFFLQKKNIFLPNFVYFDHTNKRRYIL